MWTSIENKITLYINLLFFFNLVVGFLSSYELIDTFYFWRNTNFNEVSLYLYLKIFLFLFAALFLSLYSKRPQLNRIYFPRIGKRNTLVSLYFFLFLYLLLFYSFFGFNIVAVYDKDIMGKLGNSYLLLHFVSLFLSLVILYAIQNLRLTFLHILFLFIIFLFLSFKSSRVYLILNFITFGVVFLSSVVNKHHRNKFKIIIIFIIVLLSINFNNLINARQEVARGNKVELEIPVPTVIDVYFGSPVYQSNIIHSKSDYSATIISFLNPIPVLFRSLYKTRRTSLEYYNYTLYNKFEIQDQVLMFYYDIFNSFGFVVTALIWLIYVASISRFLNCRDFVSLYLLFKLVTFSIFSLEGITITLINDIFPSLFFILVFFKKSIV
jgi:hypothetical protein